EPVVDHELAGADRRQRVAHERSTDSTSGKGFEELASASARGPDHGRRLEDTAERSGFGCHHGPGGRAPFGGHESVPELPVTHFPRGEVVTLCPLPFLV